MFALFFYCNNLIGQRRPSLLAGTTPFRDPVVPDTARESSPLHPPGNADHEAGWPERESNPV